MEREVRYCTSEDGVRIAYTVAGTGRPLLFALPHPTSIELDYDIAPVRSFFSGIQEGRSIIRFDMRGTGASQRGVNDLSSTAQCGDISALVGHLGLEELDIIAGPTLPAHAAIRYCVAEPGRVKRLVLMEMTPIIEPSEDPAAQAFMLLLRENWRGMTRVTADSLVPREPVEVKKGITRIWREALSAEWLEALQRVKSDVTELLPAIACPTLLLYPRNLERTPLDVARDSAGAIPGSSLVVIEGDSGFFFLYHEQLVGVINDFLGESELQPESATPSSAFRTVLFTDLVGHTEMMQRLGDDKGRDVLREHERITREVLKANGGTEVKTMGDGFMASFGSVTKAVECAIALQKAFADRDGEPLSVRVGLNAGEPIEEDGDLFGATVILASRIAAKAEGGEILVSNVVRELAAGKGFLFNDRGDHALKGFEDPVKLYEVSWRE
ncbi:MAG: adenylate/guanylate cyclase domain-containing protein [Dehalococcoidia bacterium]